MKKSFLFLMLAAMVAFVLACTPTEQPKPDSSKDATETPSQEPSANPSDEPSDEPSVNPTESEDPSVEPEDPSVEPEDPSVEPEGISIDGDPSDWDALDPEYVTSIVHAEAEGIGLKSGKVFYDDKVYVLLEVSDEALAKGVADGKLRFHIFFNSDYSYGGGYNSHWKELNINYATEGKMTSGGAYCDYSSKLYAIAPGTSWTTSDSGYSPVFSAAGDGNYYELSIDYTDFPGGLATTIGIGFDIADGGYTTIDYLPNDGEASHLATVVKYGTEPLEAPSPITIDGDMSDWANVEGVSSDGGPYYAFKAFSDGDNLYLYSKRDFRNTYWGGNGYFYYGIDEDNNAETAMSDTQGMPGVDEWVLIYPFGGSNEAPEIPTTPTKLCLNSWDAITAEANSVGGVIGTEFVEIETVISLSKLNVTKGSTVKIYSWGNKDAAQFKTTGITLTL